MSIPINQPRVDNNVTGNYRCTKSMPFKKEYPDRKVTGKNWSHPDAVERDGFSDDYAYYDCPNCGLHFKVELPQ